MNKPRGLFWIKGNPGAGKSVLMKFAVRMMDHRKSRELVLSFFIHGRGTLLQKTPLGVFRTLLNSMLKSFPEYLSELTKRFEDRERRFGSYQMNRWDWADKELQEFMSEVLTKGAKNQPVVIFVDALDECGKDFAKGLLTYFKDLMKDIEREEAQVKICFSSRHYPILGLNTIPTIFVENQNDKDIRLVIQERLKEIQPKAKRRQIEKEILLKAQGSFQWAVLVTAMVVEGYATGTKVEKLHEKLTSTPEALDELYTEILSGVTEAEKYQMTKLFQWVLFAERPLSSQELREALATDKDMACTTVSELRSHDSWVDTLGQFETHVKQISRGLVEFQTREIWELFEPGGEDWDREAQFVHQSVADYMLEKFLNHVGHYRYASQSQTGAGHFEISRSCIRYLTLREVLEGARLPRSTLSARFPLLPYVVRFMFHHIQEVEREKISQHDLLLLIQWDPQSESLGKIASLWRIFDPDSAHTPIGWPFIGATPLHVLVAFGSKSAFDALLQKDNVEVDGRDSDGNTPLILAIRECHQDMALALLNRSIEWQLLHGQTVDQSITQGRETGQQLSYLIDVNTENIDGDTPLTIALTEKAEEVIFKLIEAGADLKFFGRETTLVLYAIRNRNKMLLMKFIEKNAKLDGVVYFALKELSYENNDILEEFLSELLEAGANTSKSPEFDKNSENEDEDEEDEDEDEEDESGYESDDEAILLASRRGQAAMVSLLLSHSASVTSRSKYGKFPLVVAVENGHEEVVKVLLRNTPSASAMEDFGGRTALDMALRADNEAIVKLLLETGKINVDLKDSDGQTPLLWAVIKGHEAIVKLLLETNEVNINSKDSDGRTPLLWAIIKGHKIIFKLLFEINEIDIDSKDFDGRTPLSWAVSEGHETIVKLLLETNEINIDSKDSDGRTPLLWAVMKGHETIFKLLLETGKIDVDLKDSDGRTPLSWAIMKGYKIIFKLLFEINEVDIDSKDFDGRTPLSWAVSNKHEAIVKLLLETNEVDIDSKDLDGRTPLLWAAMNGHEVIVKLLLETNEVDIDSKDSNGRTPLLWAAVNGYEAIVKLLLETDEVDIDSKDLDGRTPLWWAAVNGHEAIVKLLLETGKVDVDLMYSQDGRTPLWWAAVKGYEAIVKLLLETGEVDVDSMDSQDGRTPLSWAAMKGHAIIVKLLLETSEVDVDSKDSDGQTPLSWAAVKGHEAIVKLLLDSKFIALSPRYD
jgi:ankyrin repeat protein